MIGALLLSVISFQLRFFFRHCFSFWFGKLIWSLPCRSITRNYRWACCFIKIIDHIWWKIMFNDLFFSNIVLLKKKISNFFFVTFLAHSTTIWVPSKDIYSLFNAFRIFITRSKRWPDSLIKYLRNFSHLLYTCIYAKNLRYLKVSNNWAKRYVLRQAKNQNKQHRINKCHSVNWMLTKTHVS